MPELSSHAGCTAAAPRLAGGYARRGSVGASGSSLLNGTIWALDISPIFVYRRINLRPRDIPGEPGDDEEPSARGEETVDELQLRELGEVGDCDACDGDECDAR